MRIDVHAHYFPTKYLDALERLGKDDVPESRAQILAGNKPEELEARLRMMDSAGVDMQVLSPAGQMPYFERPQDAVAIARLGNDLFAELVAQSPKRLAAFAMVPLPHVDAALEELGRALDELGMAGATIGTSVLGRSIADPAFEPFYAELNRRSAVLYVHPSGRGAESPLILEHRLMWLLGAPLEDAIAAVHLIVKGVVTRYPNIKIIVAQIGGAIPLLMGRLDFLYRNEVPECPELPSVAGRKLWYDNVTHNDAVALKCAVLALGADRLVLGSDYPYQLDDDYRRTVSFVERAGLTKDEVSAVLEDNGCRLFPALVRMGR
jgi:6-methylsalicylate decarboxylase